MNTVSREEYNARTQFIQTFYNRYREEAISIQEGMEDWFKPLIEQFAIITADLLKLDFTNECHDFVMACILGLLNVVNF